MRTATILLFFFCSVNVALAQAAFAPVWSENFEDKKLDAERWSTSFRWGRTVGNPVPPFYFTHLDNHTIENGQLCLSCKYNPLTALVDSAKPANEVIYDQRPNRREFKYACGLITSNETFLYAKFEIRCKMPKQKGTWPAVWLFGDAQYDEIDILERPQPFHKCISTNYHFDSAGIYRNDFVLHCFSRQFASKDFHTYTLEWLPDSIKWYVDGKLIREIKHHFTTPMQLHVNLATGNNDFWGYPPKRKKWNANMYIDYINVYRLSE